MSSLVPVHASSLLFSKVMRNQGKYRSFAGRILKDIPVNRAKESDHGGHVEGGRNTPDVIVEDYIYVDS